MKSTLLITISAIALSISLNSFAAGDAEAGKSKSGMCSSCHGVDGKAIAPIYPNLAGQNADYIVSALHSYKSKTRSEGQAVIMQGMAAPLTNQDIADLAAYYSSLK